VAEQRAVVQHDLAVQRLERAVAEDGERIDLRQAGIDAHVAVVQALADLGELAEQFPREADADADVARLVLAHAQAGVNGHRNNLFGGRRGHLLDVHSARAGGHHSHAASRAVQHHAQVQFRLDISSRIDQDLLHGQPLDVHAEDAPRDLLGLIGRLCQLDAAGLAAAAHQHLRLDDDRPAEALGDIACFLGRLSHLALGHGNPVLPENPLRLELLEFQCTASLRSEMERVTRHCVTGGSV